MATRSTAGRKGSAYEREVARVLGGKRTPLSGAAGGNDITLPVGEIWADWAPECKRRKALPVFVVKALDQATFACRGSNKHPAVVMREDNGRSIFCCWLDDVDSWARALAEMGRGHEVRARVRQMHRLLDEIEAMAR